MLIAAAGLAGAGKTTSLEYLARAGAGAYFYVGGIVRDEVAARGLELTPESESLVRKALRSEDGMAALARRAAPAISDLLATGVPVLVDAICNVEEARFYRATFGVTLRILAIETQFDARAARLAGRPSRAMTRDQLCARDRYELETLRIGSVIAEADISLSNDGPEATLCARLDALATGKPG